MQSYTGNSVVVSCNKQPHLLQQKSTGKSQRSSESGGPYICRYFIFHQVYNHSFEGKYQSFLEGSMFSFSVLQRAFTWMTSGAINVLSRKPSLYKIPSKSLETLSRIVEHRHILTHKNCSFNKIGMTLVEFIF